MDPKSCSMMLYDEDLLHARGGQDWCKLNFELGVMHLAPTVRNLSHVRFQTGKGSQCSELSAAA